MTATINKMHKAADDLSSKVGHHIKKSGEATLSINTRMNSLIDDTNARFNDFASRLESRTLGSPRLDNSRAFVAPRIGTAGGTTVDNADSTTIDLTEGLNDVDRDGGNDACDNVTGAGTPHAHATPDPAPPGVTAPTTPLRSMDPAGLVLPEDVYTLPSGHFGSGLGGPSTPSTRRVLHGSQRERDDARNDTTDPQLPGRDTTAMNARAAHMAGPAGRFTGPTPTRLPPVNPYTPSRPTTVPAITPPPIDTHFNNDDHAAEHVATNNGGPILSPRAQADRTRGMNRFDLEALAHPLYHGYADGTRTLTFGFLENCGYNMLSSDDVVGSLNELIALHVRIREGWFNASANTYGPQIDRILLKSFKLFPQLDSLATADVVNFYDRLQELSNPHLLPLPPAPIRLNHPQISLRGALPPWPGHPPLCCLWPGPHGFFAPFDSC